jgi:hypothetical protein
MATLIGRRTEGNAHARLNSMFSMASAGAMVGVLTLVFAGCGDSGKTTPGTGGAAGSSTAGGSGGTVKGGAGGSGGSAVGGSGGSAGSGGNRDASVGAGGSKDASAGTGGRADANIGNGGAGGSTTACGGPGEPCCAGNACNANGCCIPMGSDAGGGTTRTCVAVGQTCTATGVSGTCSASTGSCSTTAGTAVVVLAPSARRADPDAPTTPALLAAVRAMRVAKEVRPTNARPR